MKNKHTIILANIGIHQTAVSLFHSKTRVQLYAIAKAISASRVAEKWNTAVNVAAKLVEMKAAVTITYFQ